MALGIDFGTTNSALALATPNGVRFARYELAEALTPSFRSVLFFDPERHRVPGKKASGSAGVDAVREYLAAYGEGRLIQSIKTYLASESFKSTTVLNSVLSVEELVARILGELWRHASADLDLSDADRRYVVLGRPVHFAGGDRGPAVTDLAAQDELATGRLTRAAQHAGFEEVHFEFEPVAAAYHYEAQLDSEATVLVADFGGGTSDFCLMQMGPKQHQRAERTDDILGTGGVGIGGDNFDAKLIRAVVSPALGLGTNYREMGKTTAIPASIYRKVERWHHLSFLRGRDVMASLDRMRRGAENAEAVAALMHIVQWNQGFHLHECVEQTKIALSSATEATFRYEDEPVVIEATVTRDAFESWIKEEVAAIALCLDEVLERAKLTPADVDRVFMTGGSSFVPIVRSVFTQRFGAEKLAGGDELVSIASGLALRARAAGFDQVW